MKEEEEWRRKNKNYERGGGELKEDREEWRRKNRRRSEGGGMKEGGEVAEKDEEE